jgi:hypothetical protein
MYVIDVPSLTARGHFDVINFEARLKTRDGESPDDVVAAPVRMTGDDTALGALSTIKPTWWTRENMVALVMAYALRL